LQDLKLDEPMKGRGATTQWSGTRDLLSVPFYP